MSTEKIMAATISLPPFDPSDPEMWFTQAEWVLDNAGITSSRKKFQHVGASLQSKYTRELRDFLLNPPSESEDPFSKLKQILLERFGQSKNNRMRQLLELEDIGDRTPSQFLRHLQLLAGTAISRDMLRIIWTNQLDPLVQANLASQPSTIGLDELAKTADNVMDSIRSWRPRSKIATVSTKPESSLAEEFARMRLEIVNDLREVKAEIATVKADWEYERRSRAQSRGRLRPRSTSRGRSFSRYYRSPSRGPELYDGICWYHYTFQEDARKCKAGCLFNGNPSASTGNQQGNH